MERNGRGENILMLRGLAPLERDYGWLENLDGRLYYVRIHLFYCLTFQSRHGLPPQKQSLKKKPTANKCKVFAAPMRKKLKSTNITTTRCRKYF